MNIEEARLLCLSQPEATEDAPFGEQYLVYRLRGKIFACINLDRPDRLTLKCQPDRAIALRDQYEGIRPAWHWNKRHWNDLLFSVDVSDELIGQLTRHAWQCVAAGLPKRVQHELHTLYGL